MMTSLTDDALSSAVDLATAIFCLEPYFDIISANCKEIKQSNNKYKFSRYAHLHSNLTVFELTLQDRSPENPQYMFICIGKLIQSENSNLDFTVAYIIWRSLKINQKLLQYDL